MTETPSQIPSAEAIKTTTRDAKPPLSKKQRRTARAWDAVHQVAAVFPHLWPQVKERQFRAMKNGITEDVLAWIAAHPEGGLSVATWKKAIGFVVSRIEYLRTVTEGAVRVDLNGEAAGTVTKSEARHAREKIVALRVRLAAMKRATTGEYKESPRES